MKIKGFGMPAIILLGLILIVGYFFLQSKGEGSSIGDVSQKIKQTVTGNGDFSFNEDTPGYENYIKLSQGCPFKDCIPSIDNPVFESISEANSWLNDEDIIFSLDFNGEARAYPQRIMNWHEIVNDKVKDKPVLVSFCPLCGSALAFNPVVGGTTLIFGVSGKLHDNDLVMYDRDTDSLWQQITAEAIVGELFGNKLEQIAMSGLTWGQFKEKFPRGVVLSRETGYSRDYDRSPYGGYEEDSSTLFPVEGGIDTTIHPKTVVYGVLVGKAAKAYPEEKISKEGIVSDKVNSTSVRVTYDNGEVTVVNVVSGENIVPTRLFWFAWKAFYPDTEIY